MSMGSVEMGSEILGSFRYSDGYADCKITFYVYCDECGSFHIREYRTFATWAKIALCLLLAALSGAGIWYIDSYVRFNSLLTCPVCILVAFVPFALLVAGLFYTNDTVHECVKCRSTTIPYGNTLGYSAEDWSVVDVPVSLTHHHVKYDYC